MIALHVSFFPRSSTNILLHISSVLLYAHTAGRVSGHITGDFVVFIIGAHLNSLSAFFAYKKIGDLMQGMLGELVVREQLASRNDWNA